MKTITALLLAVLLCGSSFAAEKAFPDTFPSGSSKDIVDRAAATGSKDAPITYRLLLTGFSTTRGSGVVQFWIKNPKIAAATIAGLQQLADEATKAKDGRAATYRRAADKLTEQLKDNAVRQDAQSAVADALKALDKK